MKWFKRLIWEWASEGRLLSNRGRGEVDTVDAIVGATSTAAKIKIGFVDAMNGRVLEVATMVPHPGHSGHYDWKVELFIVSSDQDLSEAVAMLLLLKGAK